MRIFEVGCQRIVKIGGRFYPQRRTCLMGWVNYVEFGVCIDGLLVNDTVSFTSLDEARRFFEPEAVSTHSSEP